MSAHYYKNDAIAAAGEAAELLYVRGLAFCADVLRDGFISDTQLARFPGVGMRDVTRRAERLVEVGLWVRVEGGWLVRAWLSWNRSRDEINGLNSKDAERKGGRRGDSGPAEPPPDDTEQVPESNPIPNGIRPESEHLGGSDSERIPASRARHARPPSQAKLDKESGADADAPATVNAGTVVDAWVNAVRANGTTSVSGGLKAQVGREARKLLEDATDPTLVLDAARSVGAKGFPTLEREVVALQATRARKGRPTRPTWMPDGYDDDGLLRDPKTGRLIER